MILSKNKIKYCNDCNVCGGKVLTVISLPKLPFTDSYTSKPIANPLVGVDQEFLYCESCGHGQLRALIDPSVLYGMNYCFRTSDSSTAKKGTEFFLSVLDEAIPKKNFRCVLDLGCNDLFLLNLLANRATHRVGIDPVWKGIEEERSDKGIQLFGESFEDVDLNQLPEKPDLILCRHTLEHIVNPVDVLKSLINSAADDAIFIFELPSLDNLIERYRFDQVFHQHAQYFSLASFLKMLKIAGGKYLLHKHNFHDWGAMAIAFTKGNFDSAPDFKTWSAKDISDCYNIFQIQMHSAGKALQSNLNSSMYGYGAAQMLPVIGYHMGTDFHQLLGIIDDDNSKDGMGYWNLPVKVISREKIADLSKSAVLITAIDNISPIMTKLLANRPRQIIVPLSAF